MPELENLRYGALVLAVLLGAIIGSFSNVLIYRIPRKESIAFPPSRCPNCGHRLSVLDLIPILSWLSLKGRCRYCRAPISSRYPWIEATMALGYGLLAYTFPLHVVGLTLLGLFVFFTILIVASAIDLEHFEIPDVLSLGGALVGIGFAALGTRVGNPTLMGFPNLEAALSGATLAAGIMVMIGNYGSWVLRRFSEPRFPDYPIGFMQVNLAALTGLVLALLGIPSATLWALVLALVSVAVNAFAKRVIRIPDALTLGGLVLAVFASILFFPSAVAGKTLISALASSLQAAGAISLLAGLYYWFSNPDEEAEGDPIALGFGDTKLMGLIGAFLGWEKALVSVGLGIFAGAFIGVIVQLVTRQLFRKKPMPFGPFLAFGAIVSLFYGQIILDRLIDFYT